MSNQKSNNTLVIILVIIIFILLGLCGYLFFQNSKAVEQNEVYQVELEEADSLKLELDREYNEALAELTKYKGENEELDLLLDEKIAELDAQKAKVNRLINSGNASKKQLQEARGLIDQLQMAKINAQRQVDSLITVNNLLIELNDSVSTELVNEKEKSVKLEEDKADLTNQVELGSVIYTGNVTANGVKFKNSGSEKDMNKASRTEQIKVCFDIVENKIAKAGNQTFYIRIVSPQGVTMSVASKGSGEITLDESGEKVMYTIAEQVAYDNSKQKICTLWQEETGYQKGEYAVEVYNKGYKVGESSFTLK